jgi:hypothetical protein
VFSVNMTMLTTSSSVFLVERLSWSAAMFVGRSDQVSWDLGGS